MEANARSTFDSAYRLPFNPWTDNRIPEQVKALSQLGTRALELGCGVGQFSRYLAQQGRTVTGVDFSAVGIAKAVKKSAKLTNAPTFLVADVTRLDTLAGPFDIALDVGCFHCLDAASQSRYASEAARLVRPGGTLLIWAMDKTPPGGVGRIAPALVEKTFAPSFSVRGEPSRRRWVASHWYWLTRQ